MYPTDNERGYFSSALVCIMERYSQISRNRPVCELQLCVPGCQQARSVSSLCDNPVYSYSASQKNTVKVRATVVCKRSPNQELPAEDHIHPLT